jgi:hypothetical protein
LIQGIWNESQVHLDDKERIKFSPFRMQT